MIRIYLIGLLFVSCTLQLAGQTWLITGNESIPGTNNGTSFSKITIQNGGSLTITSNNVSITELDMAGGQFTVQSFSGNTPTVSIGTLNITKDNSRFSSYGSNINVSAFSISDGNSLVMSANGSAWNFPAINFPAVSSTLRLEASNSVINSTAFNTNQGCETILTAASSLLIAGDLNTTSNALFSLTGSTMNANTVNTSAGSRIDLLSQSECIINGNYNQAGRMITANSIVRVYGSWFTNGSSASLEATGTSKVHCYGAAFHNNTGAAYFPSNTQPDFTFNAATEQVIQGVNSFYNLTFVGGDKKYLGPDACEVRNTLDLGNSVLELQNTLTVSNPSVSAVVRSSGFVFMQNWQSNNFFRNTNAGLDYLFPVGVKKTSGNRYNPVVIRPVNSGVFGAMLVDGAPTSYPINPSTLGASVTTVNATFFHRLKGTGAAKVFVFYGPGDGSWNNLVRLNANFWSLIPGGNASTIFMHAQVSNMTGVINEISASLFPDNNPGTMANSGALELLLATGGSTQPSTTSFAVLKKNLDGGFHSCTSNLYFKFEEEYSVQTGAQLEYTVFDPSHTAVNMGITKLISTGDNRFDVPVSNLQANVFYTLEVKNSKGDKWMLRFKKS